MKKINLIYTFLVLIFIATGCRDFVDPVIPYKNFENGAYLRNIVDPAFNQSSFNFFDLNNSKFVQIVEAVDPQDGKTVETVDVYVSHRRGVNTTDEVLVKTIPASAFSVPADGTLPRTVIEVTAPEAMSALGLTEADLQGGDSFDIRLALKTTDGKLFSNNNLSGDVAGGSFFNSPFFYRVNVICPSSLGGTYAFTTTNITAGEGGNVAACGLSTSGTVDIEAVPNTPGAYTVSDISFGVFECAWGDSPPGGGVRLNDACGKLSYSGVDKYGDAYSITVVSNDGTNLVVDWQNTYGDSGQTTLVAPEGKTWPDNLR